MEICGISLKKTIFDGKKLCIMRQGIIVITLENKADDVNSR